MYKQFIKPLLDFLIALVVCPFVAIIVAIMAVFIYADDPGPIFYNAPRLGKDGKVFKMFKLRSMRVNAPDIRNADGSTYNGDNDPRVTRVGRFMRKTSVDELPQFFNVLIGDMSLVGPRAHLVTNYRGFDTLDADRQRRIAVRPGITGYNQAYFRNSVTAEEKIHNDVYYVDHVGFAFDVKILIQTVVSVLRHEHIYVTADNQTAEKAKEAEGVSNK